MLSIEAWFRVDCVPWLAALTSTDAVVLFPLISISILSELKIKMKEIQIFEYLINEVN